MTWSDIWTSAMLVCTSLETVSCYHQESQQERNGDACAVQLSDSHLAVPKAFSICACLLALPGFHTYSLLKIKSLKLALSIVFLDTSRFVLSAQDQRHDCKSRRVLFTRAKCTYLEPFRQGHPFQALVEKSSAVHALVEIITKCQA